MKKEAVEILISIVYSINIYIDLSYYFIYSNFYERK